MKAHKDGANIIVTKEDGIFVVKWPGPEAYAVELINNRIRIKEKEARSIAKEIVHLHDQRKAVEELNEQCVPDKFLGGTTRLDDLRHHTRDT